MTSSKLLEINREIVLSDYNSACKRNEEAFLKKDIKSTCQYIFPNQKKDAADIVSLFHTKRDMRVVSIKKKTKIGMDGIMIQIATNMSTHPDDDFLILRKNILFVTGMSNISWETDMKMKTPLCFQDNIYHHGQIQKLSDKLKEINNALIIIDEIDTGDKEGQKLHTLLKDCELLNVNNMRRRNIRFIFGSATPIQELKELFKWGPVHESFSLTIPETYAGHCDFLRLGLIENSYKINKTTAEQWVKFDIVENYKNDYRVHIIRTNKNTIRFIQDACIKHNVKFENHTADDRISDNDLHKIFESIGESNRHLVIAVKGLLRRANLLYDTWKLKIGAVHEIYSIKPDVAVQIQGLVGRMTGYWKPVLESGHHTGPFRCCKTSIKEYEKFYNDPSLKIKCTISKKVFMNPKHIQGIDNEHNRNYNKRVPVIINNVHHDSILFNMDQNYNHNEKVVEITQILHAQHQTHLLDFISDPDVQCEQVTRPGTDDSYKRHILDVVNAKTNNRPFIVDRYSPNVDNWQCFIDAREHRLCFVLWVVAEHKYPRDV